MKHIVIAPFEGDSAAILAGIREFPTEKVVLLTPIHAHPRVDNARTEFAKFKIPVEVVEIDDDKNFEEVFEKIALVKNREQQNEVLINLSDASGMLSFITLSAAFIHGLKTFQIQNEKLVLFPILKFSYYDMLSDKKLRILSLLARQDCCASLEELARKVSLGPSLVNYHLYGNEKNPGLKELGLVEIERHKGKILLKLTTLAKLLLKDTQVPLFAGSDKPLTRLPHLRMPSVPERIRMR